jgi:hypothetical protein
MRQTSFGGGPYLELGFVGLRLAEARDLAADFVGLRLVEREDDFVGLCLADLEADFAELLFPEADLDADAVDSRLSEADFDAPDLVSGADSVSCRSRSIATGSAMGSSQSLCR